jgi:hypothetical protein
MQIVMSLCSSEWSTVAHPHRTGGHLKRRAMNPQRCAGSEVGVRRADQCSSADRVGTPAGSLSDVAEVGPVLVETSRPALEVSDRTQMVALGPVAAIGEHQVLDSVVRPARPSEEVVDLTPAPDRITAVEARTVLQVADRSHEPGRERNALRAEQMGPQRLVLEVDAGPPRHVARPVELDEWTQHRAEHHQPVRHPGKEPNPVGVSPTQRRDRRALLPVGVVQERHQLPADHLQQRDRVPDERVLDRVQRQFVLVGDAGSGVVDGAATAGVAVQTKPKCCSQGWRTLHRDLAEFALEKGWILGGCCIDERNSMCECGATAYDIDGNPAGPMVD